MSKKAYLGDGAYVSYNGYAFVLTTENGLRETNRVVLEPDMLKLLNKYAAHVEAEKDEIFFEKADRAYDQANGN